MSVNEIATRYVALCKEGKFTADELAQAITTLGIDPEKKGALYA